MQLVKEKEQVEQYKNSKTLLINKKVKNKIVRKFVRMQPLAKNASIFTHCFVLAYAGDFKLKNETDAFQGSRIQGDLDVLASYTGTSISEKQFPNLETIDGEIRMFTTKNVQVVSLPKLKSLRETNFYKCPDLEIVELPKLENVTDLLYLSGLPKLKSLRLPALKTVGKNECNESVFVKDCTSCVSFEMPSIENISGKLQIENCPALISLLMPNLHTVQAHFKINDLENVESVDFIALKSIDGNSEVPEIIISKSMQYAMQKVSSSFCQIQKLKFYL